MNDSQMPLKCTDEPKARAVELVVHAQVDPSIADGAITGSSYTKDGPIFVKRWLELSCVALDERDRH